MFINLIKWISSSSVLFSLTYCEELLRIFSAMFLLKGVITFKFFSFFSLLVLTSKVLMECLLKITFWMLQEREYIFKF